MVKKLLDFVKEAEGTSFTKQALIEYLKQELEFLIELNEDNFDRGKGKFILREWINENL